MRKIFVAPGLLALCLVFTGGLFGGTSFAETPATAKPEVSAELQAFTTSWLEHLLGPLDDSPLPRAQILQLRTDYEGRLLQAAPLEKAKLQTAIQICVAYNKIMDAREQAFSTVVGANATTLNSVGAVKHGSLANRARATQARKDQQFITSAAMDSANATWKQNQVPWRDAVQKLLITEKQQEVAAAATATVAAKEVAPAVAPAPAAVAGPKPLGDLLRDTTWLMRDDGKYHRWAPGDPAKSFTLKADGTTSATWHKRTGYWKVTGPHTIELSIDSKGTPASLTFDGDAQTGTKTDAK